jgi:hypothetical protein
MSLPLLGISRVSFPLRVHTSRVTRQNITRVGPEIRHLCPRKASTTFKAPRIQKSAISWTSTVVCISVGAVIGLTVGIYKGYTSSEPQAEPSESLSQSSYNDMTVQLPRGRPGTLTPEEEAKLRELWHLILQLSGVAAPHPPSPNGKSQSQPQPQPPALSSESSSPSEKGSKHGLNSFKKKTDNHLEEVQDRASSAPATQSAPQSGE